nr:hypothetical protein [Plastoroseomonas hellenica]
MSINHRPGRKTVVTPVRAEPAAGTAADPAVLKALARAFRYQKLLDEGRYASITEMAAAERIERGYRGSLPRLILLAPEIIEAVMSGGRPVGLGLPSLLEVLPRRWDEQAASLLTPPRRLGLSVAAHEPAS